MTHQEFLTLPRSSSTSSNRSSSYSRKAILIPSSNNSSAQHFRSSSSSSSSVGHHFSPETAADGASDKLLLRSFHHRRRVNISNAQCKLSSFFRSLINMLSLPTLVPTCKWLTIPSHGLSVTPSLGRKVTGTLFGNRRGHVTFAVQLDPKSEPVLLLEMAVSTAALVKEMASGLVRIALESEKGPSSGGLGRRLFQEPTWTMYCNGRRCGYAVTRAFGEWDSHVLSVVRSVSVGAGVIPVVEEGKGKSTESEGELLYMRAKFERVVGSRDSEAFYMMNPDGNGGPELSIFLLRL